MRYTVGFDTSAPTAGCVAPGTITVDAPAGTVLPGSALITDSTNGQTFSVGGTRSNANRTIALNLGGSEHIEPGDHVTITFADVTSPPAGSGFRINLSTSSDPAAVQTPAYNLTAPQSITSVAPLSASSTDGGASGVTYTLGFATSSTGGLVAPGTITVAAPSGTTLPSSALIHDNTTGDTFSVGSTRSNGNATAAYNVSGGKVIGPGDAVTVTLTNVTNPPGGAQPVNLSTSSDPAVVTTPIDTGPPTQPLPPATIPQQQAPEITLALSGSATDLTGGTHSVQALARSGTAPLSGGKIVWTVGGANPASGTATAGADGTAAIAWSGAKSGTDTLTAFVDGNGNGSRDAGEPQQTFTVQWLAAPTIGKTANVEPVSGIVLIKQGNTFVRLDAAKQVPLGSTLDTTNGRVQLQTASGAGSTAKPQTGEFFQGVFQVTQTKDRAPITELTLNGALTCVKGKAVTGRRERRRSLWGSDHGGRFRTRGRRSTATVYAGASGRPRTAWRLDDRRRCALGPWSCRATSPRQERHRPRRGTAIRPRPRRRKRRRASSRVPRARPDALASQAYATAANPAYRLYVRKMTQVERAACWHCWRSRPRRAGERRDVHRHLGGGLHRGRHSPQRDRAGRRDHGPRHDRVRDPGGGAHTITLGSDLPITPSGHDRRVHAERRVAGQHPVRRLERGPADRHRRAVEPRAGDLRRQMHAQGARTSTTPRALRYRVRAARSRSSSATGSPSKGCGGTPSRADSLGATGRRHAGTPAGSCPTATCRAASGSSPATTTS